MKKTGFVFAILCLGVGACGYFPPTPKLIELENANYGSRPENMGVAIDEWMKGYFNDPFSAALEIMGELKKDWWREKRPGSLSGPYQTYNIKYGWVLPVRINAKNKMGAYTGYQTYQLCFQGEKIVAWK